jgi:3-oxoacyl-[acyl-carrier-protein] synthase-3
MAHLRALGSYLPSLIVDNSELSLRVDADPAWIVQSTGIHQRRFAAKHETVASLGIQAALQCLTNAGMSSKEVGLLLVASGSAERRFPGPATTIAAGLDIAGTPAIDLPLPSAGSIFGLALAASLCRSYGHVMVVAAEIMSRVVDFSPGNRDTAILFGDGAGACLVSPDGGFAQITDSLLASDGTFAEALTLEHGAPLHMDGRTIIMQASRKIPRAVSVLLERNQLRPQEIGTFVLHQANYNLISRVAKTMGVAESRFVCNLDRYGNTSSASMLIAAAEWWRSQERLNSPVVFAGFGAGLNWGAVLTHPVSLQS